MKPKACKLILLLSLLVVNTETYAAWYQVEIILFQHLQPDTDGEIWYSNPGLPDRSNSIELITDLPESTPLPDSNETKKLVPFLALGEGSYRLEGIYRILKLSREYRPLFHTSWQQPALGGSSSRAVHLEAFYPGEGVDEELPPELAQIQIPEDLYEPQELLFDGLIRLRSTRFLHVDVDVAYFPETMPAAVPVGDTVAENPVTSYATPSAQYVRLQESRKIKLNELHYFDHPLFGVILQVSRLAVDKE